MDKKRYFMVGDTKFLFAEKTDVTTRIPYVSLYEVRDGEYPEEHRDVEWLDDFDHFDIGTATDDLLMQYIKMAGTL